MESDSSRNGRDLHDLAKLTAPLAEGAPGRGAARPASERGPRRPNPESSGLVDLAALMAQQPNWLDDALARAKSGSAASIPPSSLAPGSLAPAAIETYAGDDLAMGVPRKRSVALVTASTLAMVMIVGASAFAWRMTQQRSVASMAPAPQAVAAAVAAPHVEEPAIPPPPAVAAEAPTAIPAAVQPVAAIVTATDAPQAPDTEPTTAPHHGKHGHHDAHRATVAAKSAPVDAVAAAPSPPPPPPAAHAPVHPVVAGSALDLAIRAAAGPSPAAPPPAPAPEPAAAPAPRAERHAAAAPSDGRPERPSGSAVTSALTTALPGARACMPSETGASRALVTFGPEGSVQRVDVTGPAASDGKVTACLRKAMSKAHVPPFSQPTYAAAVTVRPN